MVTPASSPSPTRWASISSQNFRHSNITCMSGCHLHQVHGPPRREQPCVVRHQGEGVRGAPVLLRLQQLGPLRRLLPRLPGQRQEEPPEGGGIKITFKLSSFCLCVKVEPEPEPTTPEPEPEPTTTCVAWTGQDTDGGKPCVFPFEYKVN